VGTSEEDGNMPPGKKISIKDKDLGKYCKFAIEGGATHAKQIYPDSVVTQPWVRLKCQFGCPGYDKGYCCPPDTPTHKQTREILDSYQRAILFHIEVPHMPQKEKRYRKFFDMLVDLEGEMFKDGFYKAFVFLAGPCRLCKKCAKLEEKPCNLLHQARPCMEACGMDVYQTARNNGFFIKTLGEKTETNNEYCLMLVD
jgi:predicted metal-binding protein